MEGLGLQLKAEDWQLFIDSYRAGLLHERNIRRIAFGVMDPAVGMNNIYETMFFTLD
jgi:hypothetical protein